MTRVVAPSRLHFGLLHVPADGITHWPDGLPVRRFGGVGLMVWEPAVVVRVERTGEWAGDGPSAERALVYARRAAEGLGDRGPFRVTVEACPPEHVGLGVGTQLGLASARAVAVEVGRADLSAREAALLVSRGERSAIGVHGFARGGLIVDGGKVAPAGIGVAVSRIEFPAEWRLVLARPTIPATWHGPRERRAFDRPRSDEAALRTTERMCRVALLGMLPALAERDAAGFGEALTEYNRLAGEAFAADQGGVYASAAVAELVAAARSMGATGAGQSSWGPTVFALCPDEEAADRLADGLRERFAKLEAVTVTGANNTGAS